MDKKTIKKTAQKLAKAAVASGKETLANLAEAAAPKIEEGKKAAANALKVGKKEGKKQLKAFGKAEKAFEKSVRKSAAKQLKKLAKSLS